MGDKVTHPIPQRTGQFRVAGENVAVLGGHKQEKPLPMFSERIRNSVSPSNNRIDVKTNCVSLMTSS